MNQLDNQAEAEGAKKPSQQSQGPNDGQLGRVEFASSIKLRFAFLPEHSGLRAHLYSAGATGQGRSFDCDQAGRFHAHGVALAAFGGQGKVLSDPAERKGWRALQQARELPAAFGLMISIPGPGDPRPEDA